MIGMKYLITYDDLLGIEYDGTKDIIRILEKHDARSISIILSHLLNTNSEQNYKRPYYYFLKTYGIEVDANRLFENDSFLFSLQSVLYLFKWLSIHYTITDRVYTSINPFMLNEVLHALVLVNDKLPKDEIVPQSYVFQNIKFNQQRNPKRDFTRAFLMYVDIAEDENLFNSKEYMNINTDFLEKHEYSIKEYIAACFSIMLLHLDLMDSNILGTRIHDFTKNVLEAFPMKKVINDLIGDFDDYRQWSINSIENQWDYIRLYEKPLVRLDEDRFISLSKALIDNLLFEGLFHRIRNLYDRNNDKILSFMGRLFEKYIERLTAETCAVSDGFVHIPEFAYNYEDNKSSDSYICIDDILIIIEAKAKRPTVQSLIVNSDEILFKQVKRLYCEPVDQAIEALNNIKVDCPNHQICEYSKVFIVVVTLSEIPSTPDIIEFVNNNINCSDVILGYANLSVGEYEYLCGLIEEEQSIVDYLEGMFRSGQAFRNYMASISKEVSESTYVSEKFNEKSQLIRKMVFGTSDDDLTA